MRHISQKDYVWPLFCKVVYDGHKLICHLYYKTFIQPHIDYCSIIWGQSPYISHIHILQKISLRLIMNVPNLTHSAPLFKDCQVMHIQDRVKFRIVTMVYKTLHSLTPRYMKEFLTYQSEMSTRNTRYSKVKKLYEPKQNICVSRRAHRYNGCIEFNKLPSDIQDCKTLASFKYKAFKYIMQCIIIYRFLKWFSVFKCHTIYIPL